MYESMMKVITGYGLISGFAVIGLTMWVSYWISDTFTKGRLHGSAIAILLGLVLSFWAAIYIPIVVAMAAQQNVYGAISGGPMAILAGTAAVVVAFALVPVLVRIGNREPSAVVPTKEAG